MLISYLSAMLHYLVSLSAYIIIMAASIVLVLCFIIKFLGLFEGDNENAEDLGPTETNPLKTVPEICYYGTCGEDIERGNCSYNSSTSTNNSSEDNLYDRKVCVICYDEQRGCFFVPCGHSATCCVCAQRIFYGENKACPVCRRVIGKVRKL